MLAMYSPASLEAQKLISVSIGKINASRVTRTGTSLHKSLLVASVLQKARNVYLDEERERAIHYSQCPPSTPELTVTPVCPVNPPEIATPSGEDDHNTATDNDKENRLLTCHEDEVAIPDRIGEESRLPLAEANTGNNVTHTTTTTTTVTSITNTSTITTTSSSQSSRKRRRVSDQETAAAISSILPKRLRSELKEENCNQDRVIIVTSEPHLPLVDEQTSYSVDSSDESVVPDVHERLSAPASDSSSEKAADTTSSECCEDQQPEEPSQEEDASSELDKSADSTLPDESDSDGEDSASDTSTSSGDEMEVDQLTSLVSYFSFSQSQKQSEFCLGPIHSSSGPHVLALTA